MFHDYQIDLENTANLSSSLKKGEILKTFGRMENPIWGTYNFMEGLSNPLEAMGWFTPDEMFFSCSYLNINIQISPSCYEGLSKHSGFSFRMF